MRAWLQLVRLPTVFTAMADILLGFLLTHSTFEPLPAFVGLLIASCGLYLAGMVFNDVFDVAQDTVERPGRPIPSGQISRSAAIRLGGVLFAVGLTAAGLVGMVSLGLALLLVVAILAYDGFLKRTPLGPLGMGACRFLNLLLGASHLPWSEATQLLQRPQLAVAAGLGIYIVGVTWFARTEARVSSRGSLFGSLVVMDLGLGTLVWLILTWPGAVRPELGLMLLALIGVSLNFRALGAVADPSPPRVQGLIKLFLLNYVTLSASIVFWHTGSGILACITACLVIPALLLSRLIAMT